MLMRRKRGSPVQFFLFLVLLWLLIGFILYPSLNTVCLSVIDNGRLSLGNYISLLSSHEGLRPFLNSILLGFLTVIVCGIIGTLLAFLVQFFAFPGRTIIDRLLLLPMMLPGIIIVFSFVQLYGESGLVTKSIQQLLQLESPPYQFRGLSAILVIHGYTQYVYFYIAASMAITHLDMAAMESASSLGASKIRIFFTIILPSLRPALISASIITFMTGTGSFTAPSVVGGTFKVLTVQILLAKTNNYTAIAASQAVLLTIVSLFLFFLLRLYESKTSFATSITAVPFTPRNITSIFIKTAIIALSSLLVLAVLLPVITIIVLSFVPSGASMTNIYPKDFSWQNYIDIASRARKLTPFINSITMSVIASMMGVTVAIPSSFFLVKTAFRLRWLLAMLTMIPWAIPASAVAINMINAFNQPTVFTLNTILAGTTFLLPLAYCVHNLPVMVKITNISFQNLSDTLIEASRSLGATSLQTLRNIALPILKPGIITALLVMFIRSIGEYTISVLLYNAANRPVSIAMVDAIFEYNIGLSMAYGTLLIVLTAFLSTLIGRLSLTREVSKSLSG